MDAKRADSVAPGMESVAELFDELVASGQEIGAELVVMRDGAPLLVRRGGTTDAERRHAWQSGSRVQVFSTGKPFVALAALLAVRAGVVSLDEPVTTWWHEYRDDPDAPTTLRTILAHSSGKYAFTAASAHVEPTDTAALLRDLAEQPPAAHPGSEVVEHASTYGHLVDGVLRAAGAPSIREQTERVSRALGITAAFGVAHEVQAGIAELEVVDPGWVAPYLGHEIGRQALLRPPGLLDPALLRTSAWRATSFGAVGLVTDAVSLATFYDDLARADGTLAGLLGDDLWRAMLTRQSSGFDGFVQADVEWSLGLRVDGDEFGMGGIGGSAAWHSPSLGYSMAYVTRGLGDHGRVNTLADAVEAALGFRGAAPHPEPSV